MSDRHECDAEFPLGHWSVTHKENEISSVAPAGVGTWMRGWKRAELEKIK
jgi:hypothetical protein